MTKTTDTRQLRLFILDIYNSHGETIPDGFEFYLADAIMDYIRLIYENNEDAVSARERLSNSMQRGAKRAETQDNILNVLKVKLNINVSEEFVEFAYNRSKHGEDIETFCTYWLENGGESKYWSESRMKMLWPQAFTEETFVDEYTTL